MTLLQIYEKSSIAPTPPQNSKIPYCLFNIFIFYDHKFDFTEKQSHKLYFTEGNSDVVERALELQSRIFHGSRSITVNSVCFPQLKWRIALLHDIEVGLALANGLWVEVTQVISGQKFEKASFFTVFSFPSATSLG